MKAQVAGVFFHDLFFFEEIANDRESLLAEAPDERVLFDLNYFPNGGIII